jgi:hypothetical protein
MTTASMPVISQNYSVPNVGGNSLGVNNIGSVSNVQVIPQDQARKSITFHNPNVGGNINILVSQTVDANGNALAPTFASPGGGYVIFPGGTYTFTGDIQGAWQAIAQSSSNQGLTISSSRNA